MRQICRIKMTIVIKVPSNKTKRHHVALWYNMIYFFYWQVAIIGQPYNTVYCCTVQQIICSFLHCSSRIIVSTDIFQCGLTCGKFHSIHRGVYDFPPAHCQDHGRHELSLTNTQLPYLHTSTNEISMYYREDMLAIFSGSLQLTLS